jgi:phosphoribosylglycinamide formyltransferase-1
MSATPIAIFASGRGSNFDAIQAAVTTGKIEADIRAVISDRGDAPVLAKARALGIEAICVEPGTDKASAERRREEHEKRILLELAKFAPRFIVLAGYMRILTPLLIESFRSERGYTRIVNVHPSLLPAFPGVNSYRQAFEYGVKTTGVSVHLVEREVDRGPICAQEAFGIADCVSWEEVEKRGLAVEHRLYPESLKWILREAFSLENGSTGEGIGRYRVRAN